MWQLMIEISSYCYVKPLVNMLLNTSIDHLWQPIYDLRDIQHHNCSFEIVHRLMRKHWQNCKRSKLLQKKSFEAISVTSRNGLECNNSWGQRYCRIRILPYISLTPLVVMHAHDKGCWRSPHYMPYVDRMHYD